MVLSAQKSTKILCTIQRKSHIHLEAMVKGKLLIFIRLSGDYNLIEKYGEGNDRRIS